MAETGQREPVEPDREARARALVGATVAGRYRLEALLGLGATGAVYRAGHPGGHAVAVKILDPDLMASDAAQRFVRESELVLGIHHPNVVRTLAAGADEARGLLYLAMPLLSGEDLDKVLQRTGPLDPTAAVRIAIQAARGIGAAHRVGVVHRDIKPGNLFLDHEPGPDGRVHVRVCDFGIAKRMAVGGETALTAPGSQLGTPDYVSPEQLKDSKSVDQRTDLWGLGATLYEMLSGAPPFAHHSTVFDVIAAIISEDPPHLQDRAPWIEPGLAAAAHQCLRRRPAERFANMQELVDALTPYAGGDERVTRAHVTGPSSVVKSVRRPRVEIAKHRPSFKPPAAPPVAPPAASAAPASSSAAPRAPEAPRASKSRRRPAPPRRASALPWLVLTLFALVAALVAVFWERLAIGLGLR